RASRLAPSATGQPLTSATGPGCDPAPIRRKGKRLRRLCRVRRVRPVIADSSRRTHEERLVSRDGYPSGGGTGVSKSMFVTSYRGRVRALAEEVREDA